MKRIWVILALIGLVTLAGRTLGGQTQVTCTFPGVPRSCSDPQGRWEVEWQEPAGGTGHLLWLKSVARGTKNRLLEFDRSVELFWSPGGRALAITERAGSNESVLRVFAGPGLRQSVNVEARLRKSLGRLPEIFDNGHRYFEALGWLSADVLRFRVRAYDSEPGKGYEGTFRYELAGRVSREPGQ
jgi:hypothetical protein